jgi:hypothetical protein
MDPKELDETFGILMAASMMVGVASRTPYNNVMTAMTGAMDGFMKRDDLIVAESLKEFDRNLASIRERNDALKRDMEANWKKNANDMQAYKLERDLIMARHDRILGVAAGTTKSLSEQVKQDENELKAVDTALNRAESLKQHAETAHETMRHHQQVEAHDRQVSEERKVADEETARHHKALEDQSKENLKFRQDTHTKAAVGGDEIVWSKAEVDFFALAAIQGNWKWKTGMGRTKSGSENIQRVEARMPGLAVELKISPAQMGTIEAVAKAQDASLKQLTVRSGALEQSSKKIDKDISTMDRFLESGTAGSVKLVNQPINKIREAFSSPELSELTLAAQIVGTEYERMINGGLLSAAQLHEGAREDAHRLLNADMTPEQMRRIVKLMRSEIDNQRSAFTEQIKETVEKRVDVLNTVREASPGAHAAKSGAPAKYSDPEKERRYQEFLKGRNAVQ